MQKVTDIFLDPNAPKQFKNYFKLVNIWKLSLTKNIVANTTPVKLSNDLELFVNVHDSSWLTELTYDKNTVIEILNKNGLAVKNIIYKYQPLSLKKPELKREPAVLTDKLKYIIDDASGKYADTSFYNSYKDALTEYFKSHRFQDYRSNRS